ncbi:MAG: thioredoxin domain-containing protein [Patescibacteria group bacterium]
MNILDDLQEPEKIVPRFSVRKMKGTLLFVGILTVVVFFSWKVFSFYQDIRSGAINPGLAYTTTDFTRAASVFAAKAASDGSGTGNLLGVHSPSIGSLDAKVTIVEFADFGCVYSQESAPIIRAIAKQYANDVYFVFRDYPIDELHPGASIAAEGGGCAQEQGKFWEYHDAVFANGDELSVASLLIVAEEIGLDVEKFQRCIDSGYYTADVKSDIADGAAAGVVGTPTFFFNGEKVEGSIPFTIFNQIINAMLQT